MAGTTYAVSGISHGRSFLFGQPKNNLKTRYTTARLLITAMTIISTTAIVTSALRRVSKLCISTLYLNMTGSPLTRVRIVKKATVVRGETYQSPPVEFRDLCFSLQCIWSANQNIIIDIRLCSMSVVPATEELFDFVIIRISVAYPIS